jgi:hypothetical protein
VCREGLIFYLYIHPEKKRRAMVASRGLQAIVPADVFL